jgi:1,2-diacylglycerol 3-beta-galactosyltransferase
MPNILLAFSDTGGGHRAAATALADALRTLAPASELTLTDPYAASRRWPFDRLAAAYPRVVTHASWLWHGGFRLTNTPQVTRALQALAWPALRPTFRALESAQRPDVVVSTHPLLTSPLRRAFPDVPLVVVVTDLASGHRSWYDRDASLIAVPTALARTQALGSGVMPSRIEEYGVPVSSEFAAQPGERVALAAELGWSAVRPTVLLIGGGDGVGPLELLAERLDAAQLPCDLAIVAGRNVALASRLRARAWRGTVHVYGFVNGLGRMFRAASAIVTKAGPGTISEACAAGCPLVLSGAIPGQESGNVAHVVSSGAGVWAPSPARVVEAVRAWCSGDSALEARERAAAAALAIGRPVAALDIARRVLSLAEQQRRDPRRPVHHSGSSHRHRRRPTVSRSSLMPCSVRHPDPMPLES